MDGLSSAASVIAIIQLTGSIVNICGGYIQEVKDARDEIITLQQMVVDLKVVLEKLGRYLRDPNATKQPTSSLADSITNCLSELGALEKKIHPRRGKDVMRRFGIRALKWPLNRTEIDRIIQNLERYKLYFTLSLQLDQSTLLADVSRSADLIDRSLGLNKLPVARGAEFDSYMDQHEEGCLPGTRTEVLRHITEWTTSPEGKCIFWLNGMAGTGKSTISRTVARSLREAELLGASFFFKRGEGDRGNAMKLFSTVVKQLVVRIPPLVSSLQKSIADDPDIALKSLKEQFDKLLLQPLMSLDPLNLQTQTVVIVIDALDECERDEDVRIILQLLPRLQNIIAIRLRVFLTSRPELPIRLGFLEITNPVYENLVLQQVPKPTIEHDMSLYLRYRLSKIQKQFSLPLDWPGDTDIYNLVKLSVPSFIFASTACRVLEDPQWDPVDSLAEILANRKEGSQFDRTYLPVLNRLAKGQSKKQERHLVEEFQAIVGAIVTLESPLSVISLSKLLGLSEAQIERRLNSLHSVLSIPGDRNKQVRLLHLSFRDFLLDPETRAKTSFWVDEKEMHQWLTARCLHVCNYLRKNMCGLSHGIERAGIDRQIIDLFLSPELQYSCRYWAHHLAQSKDPIVQMDNVALLLRKHFLHWMEVMSLLGLASEVVGIINLLQSVFHDDRNLELFEFLHDARRFVLKNRQVADEAPLQIYCSGLVFAPKMSIIRKQFGQDLPDWLCVLSNVRQDWGPELQSLEGHSNSVRSVSFSPDNRVLASASYDGTIRLWDAATGALQQALEVNSNLFRSVDFSPDGRLLASSSTDRTVRLWNTATGALQQTFEGHLDWVNSVAFSPNGQLLASASIDQTIQLWDTATGNLRQTLDGHSDWVNSVAFSPDGRLLASASDDKTVRLWITATGSLKKTLEGHTDPANSVAFSPDGRLLASASDDQTIRLWETETGVLQQTLEGHLNWVNSVAFSPDGRLLASASDDKAVRLWNIATGALQQTLEAHSNLVRSVTFSPDGRILASASADKTVRLWDTIKSGLQQTLESYSILVRSVAFSPDGRLLASASVDQTVRLWDAATGSLRKTLEGHSDSVNSVAFSPDGRLLASASDDTTIRLWITATGSLWKVLKGHSESVNSAAFSSDGRLLASASDDKTVWLWDTETCALKQILEGHLDCASSVAFSPDGELLATASIDQTIRIWDTTTGALQRTLDSRLDWVNSVAFSPNGQLIASASDDHTVRLWDTATGALQRTLARHSNSVRSVTFSPDSRLLASASYDETVRLWDTTTGALQQTLEGPLDSVNSVVFAPNGRLLAFATINKGVWIWDIETGARRNALECHSDWVNSVIFSPDGRLLASASVDQTVRLWDAATGSLRKTLEGHSDSVNSVAFSPDGRLLASASDDKTVRLWITATGCLRDTLDGHSDSVNSVAFSPNGQQVASTSVNQTIRIWDTDKGTVRQTLQGHLDWVRSVAFSPDSQLLASACFDGTIRIWDSTTGSLEQTLKGHSDLVNSVAFSTDGRLLASASVDKTVRLWVPATGALQQTLDVNGVVTNLEFSAGGPYLRTNLGYLVFKSGYDDPVDVSPPLEAVNIFLVQDQWVTLHGEKVLWLPPEFRPYSSAVKGNTLALGHPSGRFFIIEFGAETSQ